MSDELLLTRPADYHAWHVADAKKDKLCSVCGVSKADHIEYERVKVIKVNGTALMWRLREKGK